VGPGTAGRVASSLLALAAALAPAWAATAQRGEGDLAATDATGGSAFAVARWTIDGGGGRSSGGSYTLSASIAQPDAEPLHPATGAGYAIEGGFWPGVAQGVPTTVLFADGFEAP
jgi:hypothetical protein